ncbi:hypothetical protein NLJ89_g5573 [Agrocybe chaxingu]|uniref:Phosphoribosylglycinamide formyltransferase n=1 Tax=Agrocybe chaxingu TaxID=84603 RepID=A0A9W8K259_9AGAR|nr:hypothetical protein NLJ89_g5573 [Agrocybe chaxingu]
MSSTKRKITVLISGSGTNLQALIDSLNTPALPNAEINLVLSNRKAAYGLTRAAQADPPIPTAYLALQPFLKNNPGKTREDYDAEVAKIVLRAKPDIVVLAGWMHILSESFLELLDGRKSVEGELDSITKPIPVINLHPALPGQFDGASAIERAYEAFKKGEIKHSGVMVHRVIKDVDRGEPLIVREVPFIEDEPIEGYEKRLHDVEHEVIVQATKKVLEEAEPLQNITNLKDIDPSWQHDEIEEIVVMSSKRPSALPTIREEVAETKTGIPAATLSDFAFEISDLMPKTDRSTTSQLCVRRDTGKKYVIKKKRAAIGSQWLEQTVLEELTGLSVPFVSPLHWVFHEKEYMYIVLDHNTGGSLMDLINQHGPLGSHRAVFHASELVSGISSLHSAGIIHRNLDPQNILFDSTGHIVITGFSCADMTFSTESPSNADQFDGIITGYQAPEIILRWAHNASVDCWSFGMLLYFMHFATNPFVKNDPTEDSPIKLCNRVLRSPISAESLRLISPTSRDLMLKCLERNPAVRWTMDKIKTHPYFALVYVPGVFLSQLSNGTIAANGTKSHASASKVMPAFVPPTPTVKKPVENRARRMSLNTVLADGGRPSLTSNEALRRPLSVNSTDVLADLPSLPELLKPVLTLGIPTPVPEQDDVLEFEDVQGAHKNSISDENREEAMTRMSSFWDRLDREERGSIVSGTSAEFGGCNRDTSTKAPKLRKHRSAINAHHRLFSLSTTSFHSKLRKKPRSTGALRQAPVEVIENLPLGIHQIGSGIGFKYNLPEVVPSKLSVCSFAPSTCHSLFNGGLSAFNLGLGLGKAKAKVVSGAPLPGRHDHQHAASNDARCPCGDSVSDAQREEVGTGTFVREMYRTPSWLLSPPDSLPSPLALVNSIPNSHSLSPPLSDSTEPLTPATLVDESESVNIIIPKSLGLDCDFPDGTPDSTLRLVPPSKRRMSFLDTGVDSLFSKVPAV